MSMQQYSNYTSEDFAVWKILFERQVQNLPGRATAAFMEGLKRIQFTADSIPNFEETDPLLSSCTGWELTVVPGIVADDLFFKLLSEKKFPATTWLRKMAQLDYLEEPDMFHDVFAHVPLLTNKPFVDFLQALSKIALRHIDDAWAIELLSRIYWFTIEFGLIQEEGGLRIYGAGILSSAGETLYSLSNKPEHRPYDVATILDTPYRKDTFQEIYYIVDSYEALYASIPEIEEELAKRIKKGTVISLS
ncbi:phenylalanine 4-monooxygenase [Cesiribacter sp. SM1]|uniref:phenylalanine 4-monooxygenase n=1 Tax=Cesiribacter sp. SM1 TaxID=2861196 RepID=UPI001CD5CE56|nr:phenylalanine 4-monooxygenase [Cesiribacter sp. SM1]